MLGQRIFTIALLGCLGAATLVATERATFILTDGERISGLVVFHTESRENLIGGYLNIGTADGKEQTIPVGQVAVIDFVGGKPKVAELAALPAGANQLLALRNGTTRLGRFVNLIGGDTVRWQNTDGATQDLPIRDVNRIYLNSDSARIAFDYTPAPTVTPPIVLPPPPTGGRGSRPTANGIEVPAAVQWTDSGINVTKGQRITFAVTGVVAFSRSPGDSAGPDGNAQLRRDSYPVKGVGAGALIGKVGRSPAFLIGVGGQPVEMPANGRLMLGVNDDKFDDNSGSFRVVIKGGS
jgi:hypothetical protein